MQISKAIKSIEFDLEKTKKDALHGARCEKVAIQEPPSLPNKQPPQKQHTDSAGQNVTKSLGATASLSTEEPLIVGAQASSKTANGKGMVSTQSVLTKLTNQLNFLKERCSHLVTELQILGTSRVPEGPLLSPGVFHGCTDMIAKKQREDYLQQMELYKQKKNEQTQLAARRRECG